MSDEGGFGEREARDLGGVGGGALWGWGHAPRILHALKCVLGASEALFRACTQYIYTCKLPSSSSGFMSKSIYDVRGRGPS